MSELVEFLRARLDEDEQAAQQEQILVPTFEDAGKPRDEWPTVPGVGPDRRAIREVEAKRRIIDLHGIVHRNIGWLEDGDDEYGEIPVCGLCVPRHSHFRRREDVPEGPCPTVRLLALPYIDHPDYREEWKP